MESVGVRLKKIRLEKGLSLEEVHKKTKVHLSILKAIEEDSLVNFSPVYIKGFLKIYANFLKVDPKDYIAGYKNPQSLSYPGKSAQEKPPASFLSGTYFRLGSLKSMSKKISLLAAIILALVFLWIFLWIGLFKLGKAIFNRQSISVKKPKVIVMAPAKISSPSPAAEITPKEQKPPVKPAAVRLGIVARENCWIEVKVDGRTIFKSKLLKGMMESWEAKEKIELSLGNAGVVDLNVNGQHISTVGKKGQTVKNILINKEGLTIKR